MVTFKIASGCLDRIIDRIRPFAGRTANVAFVAVPSAPHRPSFAFFDVNRIPDNPFGVIVLMDFLNRHRTSFRLNLTFASNLSADKFAVWRSGSALRVRVWAVRWLRFGDRRGIGTIHVCKQSKMGSAFSRGRGTTARPGYMRPMGLMGRRQKPDTKGPSAKGRTPNAKRRTPNVHS